MTTLIGDLADRALSLIVPKADAWAYKAGCANRCNAFLGCSDWECCLIGSSTFWQRSCPRTPNNPSGGCYLSFSGKC
ncbi:hypothetical protein [Virgisporangium aurantiacum]|uniref:Uncharacterized protein n=1 Tax=Virgisporangium aurantiacum TaxID=175570 RepID=A0A8J4E6K8_9ACTN|nr:hypothetical protein [Virgisporangium aurantiacum]GIJ64195.1 hypothetical protein Vau01_117110 [Virgisporangium aurantiacum]